MKLITRYIAREITLSTLMVTAGLCGLYIIFALIKETQDIGNGQYHTFQALWVIALNLPANLYLVLPMSALLGILIGLGNLANQHELVILQTSGCSLWQICRGVLFIAAFMMPITFLLGAYIAPIMSHKAMVKKALAEQSEHALLMGTESIWLKDGPHFIHIGKTMAGGQLEKIERYEIENNQLKRLLFAQSAEFDQDGWLLHQVTQMSLEENRIVQVEFESLRSNTILAPDLIDVVASNPQQLTLSDLGTYIHYRQQNALNSSQYELAYWRNIFQPFSTLLLMLFAVPFVLGSLRSSTTSLRFVFGVIVGVLLYTVDQFFGPFSLVYRFNPLIGAAAPSIIFSIMVASVFWWYQR